MTRVLVLGAYGLIGAAIARRLREDGCAVTGLGRNARTANATLPDLDWVIRDLTSLRTDADWLPLLDSVDYVVNCAGALQQSARDDLDTVHRDAVAALASACATKNTGLIQISAVGVAEEATTAFLRTKAAGDAAVRNAGIAYWIFRPGLVLAPTAYGGTALLRMLAAIPLIQPLALPDTRIQTVSVFDVAEAVSGAVAGRIPPGTACDLVEDTPHSLRDIVAAQRRWLGFAPARREIALPTFLLSATAAIADGLGRLGWRSPLRSTAIRVLAEDVTGDPAPWRAAGEPPLSPMHETLSVMPATVEDRLFARMALLMPVVIGVLAVFWFASGVIGLLKAETAARVLTSAGWPHGLALASIIVWALVDIAIAAALLLRKYAGYACWAMVVVSVFYLAAATFAVPHLWADPLGPLVKILPVIALALVARAMLEAR